MTHELLYLSRREVAELLPSVAEQVELAERTYRAHAAGRAQLPPKPTVYPRPDCFLNAMPAYLSDGDVVALKWVAAYPPNTERGLPYISGLVVVNDAETGFPLAVMDAAEITAARTAAASGACVVRLAPPGWRRAAVLGCGEQGRHHARMLRALNPQVELMAWDPDAGRLAALEEAQGAPDARSAVEGAQVVVTAAPIVREPQPEVGPEWLGERWLLLPIDYDASARREAIAAAGRFYVDDVAQFESFRAQGHFAGWPSPHGATGDGLARPSADRVACVNLGIGALDAAFAAAVLERARASGVGTRLPL